MFNHYASVKDYPSLWVHVDAAWAGVALSCEEHRERLYLNEINEFAKSFCTNFHKVRLTLYAYEVPTLNVNLVGAGKL